jgi:hypothetical protein
VDESSEEVVTSKPLQHQMGGYDRRGAGLGWDETEPTMRSVPVVVAYVDGRDTLEVATADDEQAVKALAANGAHPTFGVGVGDRGSRRACGRPAPRSNARLRRKRGRTWCLDPGSDGGITPRSSILAMTLRACWVTQCAVR